METMIYLMSSDMDALYENSKPFAKFLKKQGLENTLRQTQLKLRERHTIVPHVSVHPLSRLYLPLMRANSAYGLHWTDQRMRYPNFLMKKVGIAMYVHFVDGPLLPGSRCRPRHNFHRTLGQKGMWNLCVDRVPSRRAITSMHDSRVVFESISWYRLNRRISCKKLAFKLKGCKSPPTASYPDQVLQK